MAMSDYSASDEEWTNILHVTYDIFIAMVRLPVFIDIANPYNTEMMSFISYHSKFLFDLDNA